MTLSCFISAPLPHLPDVSAIHSTTMTTHIDETMSSFGGGRRSSTDTLASFTANKRRSSDIDSTTINSSRRNNSDNTDSQQCEALLNCKV